MSSDKQKDIESLRRELCTSFDAVAEAMRNCAQMASTFSKYVARLPPATLEEVAHDRNPELTANGKKKRKPREKKDPNQPKRPTSAYLLFQNEVRKYYQDQNPGKSYNEVLNQISRSWKELSEDKKDVYKKRVEAERVVYEERMREYNLNKQQPASVDMNGPTKKKESSRENGAPTPIGTESGDEDDQEGTKGSEIDSEDGTEGSDDESEEEQPPVKKHKPSKSSK